MTNLHTTNTGEEEEVSADTALSLLPLSNMYQLDRLKEICESIIQKDVEWSTVRTCMVGSALRAFNEYWCAWCQVAYCWEVARLSDAPTLLAFCTNLMTFHWREVRTTEAFGSLPAASKKRIQQLIASPAKSSWA